MKIQVIDPNKQIVLNRLAIGKDITNIVIEFSEFENDWHRFHIVRSLTRRQINVVATIITSHARHKGHEN